MFSYRNEGADPDAARLVKKTLDLLGPHWQRRIPQLSFCITDRVFDTIPELKFTCADLHGWEGIQVLRRKDKFSVIELYVRRDKSDLHGADLRLQATLLELIGMAIWEGPHFQKDIARSIAKEYFLEGCFPEEEFREGFPHFFLTPKELEKKNIRQWSFMKQLDQRLARETFAAAHG